MLLFLGINMVVILLFTSSVFTNWISTHFSEASSSTFNPYLVSGSCLYQYVLTEDGHLLGSARIVGFAIHRKRAVLGVQITWTLDSTREALLFIEIAKGCLCSILCRAGRDTSSYESDTCCGASRRAARASGWKWRGYRKSAWEEAKSPGVI